LRYALAAVRKRGRGPFTDDEWAFLLRLWHYVEEFDRRLDLVLDQRRRRLWRYVVQFNRRVDLAVDQRRQRPFTDTEEWLIVERSGVLERYQDQLAERVRGLQVAEREEARDKAGSGSDLLLTVISL
jgi:hypothetical protein